MITILSSYFLIVIDLNNYDLSRLKRCNVILQHYILDSITLILAKFKTLIYRYATEMYKDWQLSDSSCVKLDSACEAYTQYKINIAQTLDPKYSIVAMIPCLRLWPWIGGKFETEEVGFLFISLTVFSIVSRKTILTYRLCLYFQYLSIGLNLNIKCEKSDRPPTSFFYFQIRLAKHYQFFFSQKYLVLYKTKYYIKSSFHNLI